MARGLSIIGLAALLQTAWPQSASSNDATQAPSDLQAVYAAFVQGVPRGDTARYALPGFAPTITPGSHWEILLARKEGDDAYLLRTASAALWFVNTKTGGWKLFRYVNKPVE